MRRLVFILVVCSFFATPLFADPTVGQTFYWQDKGGAVSDYQLTVVAQVTLTRVTGSSSGGAFLVTVNQGSLPLGGGFKTFCIEDEITFSPGTKYWVSVDPRAYSGNSGKGLTGDPISNVTEYIYDTWKSGSAPALWTQSAVSQAIWHAEEEIDSVSGDAKKVYEAAVAAIGGAGKIGNAGHTWALNLWNSWTKDKDGNWIAKDVQSQLITVPVPGAVLLGFLGLGYAGMRLRKRV